VPTLENGPVSLHYQTSGDGPPLLLLAPGGLRASRAETWSRAPWSPIEALSDRYRIVAMDQRNTGTSFAPITSDDGWATYAADQLAVMDHLGVDRFGVVGMCIGGGFILRLIAEAPERIDAAVLMQPIGQVANRDEFRAIFDEWRSDIAADHPEATDSDWDGCWSNLFGNDNLMWTVPDAQLPTMDTAMLVLRGDDAYHPKEASEHLAATAPNATLIENWKDPADQPAAREAVDRFLDTHLL
jgi:pimeloyl-ACP methyl ester carboxylesterase